MILPYQKDMNMNNCTCNNSVMWDGIRYCPDCSTHTTAPTQDELNRKIQYLKAKEELVEDD